MIIVIVNDGGVERSGAERLDDAIMVGNVRNANSIENDHFNRRGRVGRYEVDENSESTLKGSKLLKLSQ